MMLSGPSCFCFSGSFSVRILLPNEKWDLKKPLPDPIPLKIEFPTSNLRPIVIGLVKGSLVQDLSSTCILAWQVARPNQYCVIPLKIEFPTSNPGVYREFGFLYTRSTPDVALPGSSAEGLPGYQDYTTSIVSTDANSISQDVITSITDNWTPLLDELRYCKHIYALRFKDRVFPPEPSESPWKSSFLPVSFNGSRLGIFAFLFRFSFT